MTRGASIAVIIAMSLMCSFDGHDAAATGYFYEHPIRPYNPPTLSTLRSRGQYDAVAAGSKVVTSSRPRVTVPPIPSLPPLTSLTTPPTKNTNRQPGVATGSRPRPPALAYPRPTVPARQQQKPPLTQSVTKPPQFQQQPRSPTSQVPTNAQYLYQRQQSLRPTTSTATKASLPAASRPTLKITPPSPTKLAPKSTPKPLPKPTPRLASGASAKFPTKTASVLAPKQPPTLSQRPSVLPAPPLPKLPPTSAQPQRPVAQATTLRPTAPPALLRRWSFQKPDQVSTSRPIQASSSSSLLHPPEIYVINGRQLKQYKVYEQIDNDIEQDLGSFIPANFFLSGYHARIGPSHPLGEDLQVQSRLGHQRSQQLLQPPGLQSPNSIALGSGGLGFVKLPNGNVYLGSGSLGYISGLQRTLEVVDARTRSGAPEPDATHFGHGTLSDSFYYGSD